VVIKCHLTKAEVWDQQFLWSQQVWEDMHIVSVLVCSIAFV